MKTWRWVKSGQRQRSPSINGYSPADFAVIFCAPIDSSNACLQHPCCEYGVDRGRVIRGLEYAPQAEDSALMH